MTNFEKLVLASGFLMIGFGLGVIAAKAQEAGGCFIMEQCQQDQS